ncbi:DUF4153 domain-containing protein [Flavobacterium rhamnosiphilum]|uniref:DUF4153 domain-containing protein n=1 Tax=Flavobacterium rhamnosiphilum TaxID=2541724 RepID=A0A4R5F9N0_9FLAO|nr:DUF4153 domain-containing protein [Flavobacterium rhamnosiphilum]TDE45373.1 DUF4153 domain-containing protein [Flavobacterium rhamnosiphilum]
MAKFPSFHSVLLASQKTIFRFPLETILTILGTVFAISLSEERNDTMENFYTKSIMCCSLCLVLFLSVSLYFSATQKNSWIRFLTSLLLGGLVTTFIFSFSEKITDVEALQFLVLDIAFHLLVSFAGFLPKAYDQEEFWEFNKQLFLRILTAGLYSVVLYSGLSLAILAVHHLFNVDFYDKIYLHLFFIIAGIFNTLFFLSGVPETNNGSTPLILKYPKGLKNFTQYVLLPLISIYLVILICYETKILVTLSLPVGWVSNLVLVFAIFGILSFLLVHPIAEETENLWMRTFNRWFYYLLVPLLGLLFWAILYRINLYGFTHERYYVLALSIWLTIVVAYFIIKKEPKIKFIPITMCITALLTILGPQSADTISKNSQLSRFESYLQKIEKEKLTFEQEQDLSSIVDFLEENYGSEVLLPFAKDKLTALIKKDKNPNSSQIMMALGLQYRSDYDRKERNNTEYFYNFYENNNQNIENIQGYDMSFSILNTEDLECNDCITIDNKSYSIISTKKEYGVDLQINQDIVPLKIVDFVNQTPDFDYNENWKQKITQKIETPKYTILIYYMNVGGERKGNKKTVNQFQIKVLLGIKN